MVVIIHNSGLPNCGRELLNYLNVGTVYTVFFVCATVVIVRMYIYR